MSISAAVIPAPRALVELRELAEPSLGVGSIRLRPPREVGHRVRALDERGAAIPWHAISLRISSSRSSTGALATTDAGRLPNALVRRD